MVRQTVVGTAIGGLPRPTSLSFTLFGNQCATTVTVLSVMTGVTITAVLLFSNNPRRFNQGGYLKNGGFDEKGVLRWEDIIEVPLILIPDLAVETLFDRYEQPTSAYEGAFRKLVRAYPRDAIGS